MESEFALTVTSLFLFLQFIFLSVFDHRKQEQQKNKFLVVSVMEF